jgi:hypothetical protein
VGELAFGASKTAFRNEGSSTCAKSQLHPLQIGDEVNFRLVYQGPLKAASRSDTRRIEKHQIRCVLSRQLRQLFNIKDRDLLDPGCKDWWDMPRIVCGDTVFLSLIREKLHLVCDLDILFLRRDHPGKLIGGGGDLDNRIKVLFDAFRVPDEIELRGLNAEPFIVCLLEDDKLITGFRVTTDRLLEPAISANQENDVHLIVNVEIKATRLTPENMAYFSHF